MDRVAPEGLGRPHMGLSEHYDTILNKSRNCLSVCLSICLSVYLFVCLSLVSFFTLSFLLMSSWLSSSSSSLLMVSFHSASSSSACSSNSCTMYVKAPMHSYIGCVESSLVSFRERNKCKQFYVYLLPFKTD